MRKTNPTRRDVAANAAASAVAAALGLGEASAAALGPDTDGQVQAMWARRLDLRRRQHRASAMISAAEAALPAWAQPGPQHMESDGSLSGPEVGWPALQNVTPPERPGLVKVLRFDRGHARSWWRTYREAPDAARRTGARNMLRQWIALQKAWRAEKTRLGLPEMQATSDALTAAIIDLEDDLSAFVAEHPGSAVALACRAMMDIEGGILRDAADDLADWLPVMVIRHLAPSLDGLVGEHAREIADAGDRRFSELAFMGAADAAA